MLVSIIVNNYNYGRYVGVAIESALRQTHPAVEVIVVDDGSTDESRQVIAGFGERVTAIYQPNGGQAAALNTGWARARGEVAICLDADDVLLPHTAAEYAAAFAADPSAARAHCRMTVIDAEGRPTGGVKPAPHLPLLRGDLRRQVLSFPDDLPWLPTSGNAYAARVLRQIMPIPADTFRILADYYLSHVTPLFGPVLALEAVGAHYRVHGANNYARDGAPLDLEQVRRTITYWRAAHVYVQRYAAQLGLPGCPATADDVLSVALTANRLVSLKLEPARHPVPSDTAGRLLRLGWRAAGRRFDVGPETRLKFRAWFLVMAFAPRPAARRLAELFLLPERRPSLGRRSPAN